MYDIIIKALGKGAALAANISGGKDGDAMVQSMIDNGFTVHYLIHCELGSVEWKESIEQCRKCSVKHNIPLHVVKRTDGRGLLEHWIGRMNKLKGTGKPFWSSSKNRYCTSDLKRDVADKFFRNQATDFIISCEGIRAAESAARSKKPPVSLRYRITSPYYEKFYLSQSSGIKELKISLKRTKIKSDKEAILQSICELEAEIVDVCIANYKSGNRLAITWYPIFNFTTEEVWNTCGNSSKQLAEARQIYTSTATVPDWWNFHPAYVYGNERVSCMLCIMGSKNDLINGMNHNPQLYEKMLAMEVESGFTFRQDISLASLKSCI